ncbi:MAG: tyrosine-type recombinase/integrase [Fusobacteriaceae bacterium]|jgi:integrase/recombinase XerD|nr:tyrosine-type recombinase/integrase [Fusobacteriaceae bacterium]
MNIKIKDSNSLTIPRKKRTNRSTGRNIFEAYKSPKTLEDYQFYLKKFLNFIYEGDANIKGDELISLMTGVTEDDVNDYIVYLIDDRALKKTSINKILSAMKSLYKELENYGYDNPFKKIKLFKVARNLDHILKLSFDDIKKIIGLYTVNNFKSYRNITIFYTLFYSGMRSQELLDLQFRHITERDNNYFMKLEKTKSGREQYKPVHDDLVKILYEYKNFIHNLYSLADKQLEDTFVFSSSVVNNTKLSYRALYDIIQDMGKLIGKNISPHNIRHSIATELSLNGADLIEIRDFLGHSDTRVTEIYINAKNILEKRTLEKIPDLHIKMQDD